MYNNGPIVGGVATTSATVAVTVLPNTGSDVVMQLAMSVAAGMLVWGVLYVRQHSQA